MRMIGGFQREENPTPGQREREFLREEERNFFLALTEDIAPNSPHAAAEVGGRRN